MGKILGNNLALICKNTELLREIPKYTSSSKGCSRRVPNSPMDGSDK